MKLRGKSITYLASCIWNISRTQGCINRSNILIGLRTWKRPLMIDLQKGISYQPLRNHPKKVFCPLMIITGQGLVWTSESHIAWINKLKCRRSKSGSFIATFWDNTVGNHLLWSQEMTLWAKEKAVSRALTEANWWAGVCSQGAITTLNHPLFFLPRLLKLVTS
jgi:hypothetical protein